MYAVVYTRPDIAHVVGVISHFLSNPVKEKLEKEFAHWNVVKLILRYIHGTTSYCPCYGASSSGLEAYTNADWAVDVNSRKSTSGYLVCFANGVVSRGNQDYKSGLHSRQSKLNTLQLEKHVENYYGWRSSFMSWAFDKRGMCYFAIVKVQFI